MTQRQSRAIRLGPLAIGGGAPVMVQSMTNTDTRDVEATTAQIARLVKRGCEAVRLAVPDEAAVKALAAIRAASPVPLIADIHFDYRLAVAALESGLEGLRINPGNIGPAEHVDRVVDAAKAHGAVIRIGVNSGSVEKELLRRYGGPCPQALVESALNHVRLLERRGFYDTKISLKSSSVTDTIAAGNPGDGTHSHGSSGEHGGHTGGSGAHVHTDEGPHVHDVLIPEKMRWIQPGDHVLVAWVGNDPVVIDIILPATEVG